MPSRPRSARPPRPTPAKSARASVILPKPGDRRWFRTRLLAWYGRHGRSLPWRTTDDPYHILVSEVMLQQTQVDRVLPSTTSGSTSTRRSRRLPTPRKTKSPVRGGHLATTSARAACRRSRASRSRGLAASCHRTKTPCSRSKASVNTPREPSGALPSESARQSSIPTSHACCTACSSRPENRKHTLRGAISGRSPRRSCLTSTSSTSTRP